MDRCRRTDERKPYPSDVGNRDDWTPCRARKRTLVYPCKSHGRHSNARADDNFRTHERANSGNDGDAEDPSTTTTGGPGRGKRFMFLCGGGEGALWGRVGVML